MLAKKFGFGFGIAILLPMLVHFGVSTFTPRPQWRNYYNSGYNYNVGADATKEEKQKAKEERKKRDEEFRKKRKIFERRLFYVATPVGIASIAIGSYLAVQAVGAGLIFGGIFTLADGYCWYWSELDDWMRFVSLLIAFVVMIVIGYTKLNNKTEERVKGEDNA